MSDKTSEAKVHFRSNAKVHEVDLRIREANVRLCQLCLWRNRKGIGFHIAPSSSSLPVICMVESNSPASAGGLKICDAILAVNNKNISEANYQQATTIIKTALNTKGRVDLLVVEQKFYKELKKNDISMISSSAKILVTPHSMPADFFNFPKHQPRTCDIHVNQDNKTFGFEVVSGDDNIGIYIQEVAPDSAASNAGLRKSDRIIEINGTYIEQDSNMNYQHYLWIAQASVYVDIGDDKSKLEATKLFEFVLYENPLHDNARLNLAILHFNPSHVHALETCAIVGLQMNHPTEAFIDLNQVLHFQPSSAPLLANRSVIQQFLDDNRNQSC
ncbi:unnamed protein product [Rotaria sp. Silwood2]|nr:unnamed protein product [Rotaria sp. Silwood2]